MESGAHTESGGLLTTIDVAEFVGKTPKTVRKWLDRGYFPKAFRPPGGQWRVPQSDVHEFLNRMSSGRRR